MCPAKTAREGRVSENVEDFNVSGFHGWSGIGVEPDVGMVLGFASYTESGDVYVGDLQAVNLIA